MTLSDKKKYNSLKLKPLDSQQTNSTHSQSKEYGRENFDSEPFQLFKADDILSQPGKEV